ncbi:hypothetical protein SDD30_12635 [Moorella naiadis]|uniref:hypothetical protein n=1 Tax=Moorella naiadis (nom. illeg.) TaxID=3093670 RepID=UPI003D9CAC8B
MLLVFMEIKVAAYAAQAVPALGEKGKARYLQDKTTLRKRKILIVACNLEGIVYLTSNICIDRKTG